MPNKQRSNVRKSPGAEPRSQRTKSALAKALFQLIQERENRFDDITVRQVLERAGVGRTTFYSHFRSKEDVVHWTYEFVFGAYKTLLRQESPAKGRLFPVVEYVDHVARSRPVMIAFRKAGLADDMRSQFIAYASDIIECRIRDLQLSTTIKPRLAARMLAAALIESIEWWFDHDSIAPGEIDIAFQALARTVTREGSPIVSTTLPRV
jgi:AcrR family transcriptional regulator